MRWWKVSPNKIKWSELTERVMTLELENRGPHAFRRDKEKWKNIYSNFMQIEGLTNQCSNVISLSLFSASSLHELRI